MHMLLAHTGSGMRIEKFASQPNNRHSPCTKRDRESGWTKNPTPYRTAATNARAPFPLPCRPGVIHEIA